MKRNFTELENEIKESNQVIGEDFTKKKKKRKKRKEHEKSSTSVVKSSNRETSIHSAADEIKTLSEPIEYSFRVDEDDHCETPEEA
jgi:hypothetical protein